MKSQRSLKKLDISTYIVILILLLITFTIAILQYQKVYLKPPKSEINNEVEYCKSYGYELDYEADGLYLTRCFKVVNGITQYVTVDTIKGKIVMREAKE